jgi:PHD/YefM family antitoxin component YafN of YafNO toxin-antitoxin module
MATRTQIKAGHAMINVHEEYLVDQAGNRKAVVVPLAEWQQIKEELEELDDIRTYDEAKRHPSEPVPFEEAMTEIGAQTD